MIRQPPQTWTTKLVADRMVEAMRWAIYSGGRVGPAQFRGSLPAFAATLDDHLAEGWGLPELAGDEEPEERRIYRNVSVAQVTAYEAALGWPATYLYPGHEGSARILGLWLVCAAQRSDFEQAVKRRGTMSRSSAFRMRERALTLISVGLTKDRVPHERTA